MAEDTHPYGLSCDKPGSYQSADWQGPSWYRMQQPAGTMMIETEYQKRHCDTYRPGYLVGGHPVVTGQRVNRTVSFHWGQDKDIEVTNCGNYYVYNLPEVYGCTVRYCST